MEQAEFHDHLNADVRLIETALDRYLSAASDAQDIVREAMRYSVSAGGKRIRPVLVLEFCRMLGGDSTNALPFACALEMIHSYSLIHDDLPCMDDDDMRRGKPSCHIQFGEANALLAGDALLTLAFHTITDAKQLKADQVVAAVRCLSEYAGINGMIGGQVIDLAYEGKSVSTETLHTIHCLKTGALLSAACKLGAIAADADDATQKIASEYGNNLGLAFQIIDDILDVVGDEQALGKPIGSDASNEKTTYVTLYGMEKAQAYAAEYTDAAMQLLNHFENHAFLHALTSMLLHREN